MFRNIPFHYLELIQLEFLLVDINLSRNVEEFRRCENFAWLFGKFQIFVQSYEKKLRFEHFN